MSRLNSGSGLDRRQDRQTGAFYRRKNTASPGLIGKTPWLRRMIYLASRGLAVLYALFIGLFALDALTPPISWVGFGIHLIPTTVVLILTWVAWEREYLAGLVFLGLGALYLIAVWGRASTVLFLTIPGPLFLIGALFVCQAAKTTRWIRETLLAAGIGSLLGLDSAAFHDIAKAEPDLYLEYTILTVSIIAFAVGGYWEWRRRAQGEKPGTG